MSDQPIKTDPKPDLGNPIPVRFTPEDKAKIDEIANRTGLPVVQVIRLATKYCLPRFESGEINIFDTRFEQPANA